ncbi:Flavonol synthase/flavanone 3-hydroxylase [Vitis vinifera]|uniref:Flavonol synthase/flavanone 3-hydroxylase n=1 Tax=Vitis vinifera TaxID=29760 RepID=A0A438C3E6_VITVI|nr:Flavonol synthase/flavanone 3-hydroxylase [Vitis vinifera]
MLERVQAIAFSSLSEGTIPPEFIRSEEEQPAITTFHGYVPQVPTIDFSDPDEANLTRLIAEASMEWGIFQIVNHGIPSHVITSLQKVGREFFELSQEEKELYAKPPDSKSIEGYGTKLQKEQEGKKPWVDHLFHKVWPPSAINYHFWPKNPPSYRPGSRVVAHTDMSSITMLVPNEVQGLQVFRDDHWFDVKYIPNALVIHIGDQLEVDIYSIRSFDSSLMVGDILCCHDDTRWWQGHHHPTDGLTEIVIGDAAVRDRGGGTWAMAGLL